MELQAKTEMTVSTEPLVNQRPTLPHRQPAKSAAHAIHRLDLRALLDPREPLASLETLVPLDNLRPEAEAKAHPDHLDPLVLLELLDPRDHPDLPDNNNPVALDPLDHLVHLEPQDLKDPPDQMVNLEREAAVDQLDPLDHLDPTASLATMALLDPLDKLDKVALLAVATTAHRLDWRLDIRPEIKDEKNVKQIQFANLLSKLILLIYLAYSVC